MTGRGPSNPYVGPRSIQYGEPIHGRDREIDDITDMLVSERIVLLYSPSGAGKSSLLDAGVRPRLEERGFDVLPTVRVGLDAGAGMGNRYLFSTKLSLSEALPPQRRLSTDELSRIGLGEQIDRVLSRREDDQDSCLIFDQFEELFTLDPTDVDEKRLFLTELGIALRDRSRWALFAIREDYIARLDPHLSLLPTRLSHRFRLDLLAPWAARLAAVRPAEQAAVPFADDAADRLIDDLRKMRVSRAGTTTTELGPYVEPVVLQVVCQRLWEHLASTRGQRSIEVADVESLGDVDDALADFCDDQFARAASTTQASEQRIRDWIARDLIDEHGFRMQTMSGPADDGPAVLTVLEDGHLLRAESRRGATWFEIAHDRMVAPVQSSNARWFTTNLDPVQTAARAWQAGGRSDAMLLRGELLEGGERWIREHPDQVLSLDREFVDASRSAQFRADQDRERQRRSRRTARIALIAALATLVGLVFVGYFYVQARHEQNVAENATEEAERAREAAEAAQRDAEEARAQAETEADRAERATEAADDAQRAAATAEETLETKDDELTRLQQELESANEDDETRLEAEVAEAVAQRDAAEAEAARLQLEAEASELSAAWTGDYVSPDFPSSIEVRLGAIGDPVGWLQRELQARGADLVADCRFGRTTEGAVQQIQAMHSDVANTGIADAEFWALLGFDATAPDPLPFRCPSPDPVGEECTTAYPAQGIELEVRGTLDEGLNFRTEPNLGAEFVINPAPNGTQFTAMGDCVYDGSTNWWTVSDDTGSISDPGTTGWAGAGYLFRQADGGT